MKSLIAFIFMSLAMQRASFSQSRAGFAINENPAARKVDILFDGKLLTSYCYYDSIRKPILFPVNTPDGITVTRGYPIAPRAGERTDHPHHTGIWLNYESVNGLDFWNNSTAIPLEKRNGYGTIFHETITGKKAGKNSALLSITANWKRPDQKTIIREQTSFVFTVKDGSFFIDRKTVLTATDTTVVFRDIKDGFMAIRVARELEMPSRETSSFIDDKGNVTKVEASSAGEVTGMYHSSAGKEGDAVWATRGKWVTLTGTLKGRGITIGITDHPLNPGYPAYWHARGYGLFAINPLGQKIFSNGKEELNLTLQPKQSVTFRYRVIIHSGSHLNASQMDQYTDAFSKTK